MARYFVCINLLLYYFLSCQIWTLFWESLAFVLAIHCVDLLFSMSRYIFAPKTWCMVSMVCIMSLFGRDTRTCIGYGWRGCWWKGQKMNTVLTWNVFFCRELGHSLDGDGILCGGGHHVRSGLCKIYWLSESVQVTNFLIHTLRSRCGLVLCF